MNKYLPQPCEQVTIEGPRIHKQLTSPVHWENVRQVTNANL